MKRIKFLLDANISPETAVFLRSLGFDTKSLIEEGLGGITDAEVVRLAIKEKRTIVTFDLDFGERHFFAMPKSFGGIILRLDDQRPEATNIILEQFLNTYKYIFLKGQNRLAIIKEGEARII